jgi:hypothetical protein
MPTVNPVPTDPIWPLGQELFGRFLFGRFPTDNGVAVPPYMWGSEQFPGVGSSQGTIEGPSPAQIGALSPDINSTILPNVYNSWQPMDAGTMYLANFLYGGGNPLGTPDPGLQSQIAGLLGGPGSEAMKNAAAWGVPNANVPYMNNMAQYGIASPGSGNYLDNLSKYGITGPGMWPIQSAGQFGATGSETLDPMRMMQNQGVSGGSGQGLLNQMNRGVAGNDLASLLAGLANQGYAGSTGGPLQGAIQYGVAGESGRPLANATQFGVASEGSGRPLANMWEYGAPSQATGQGLVNLRDMGVAGGSGQPLLNMSQAGFGSQAMADLIMPFLTGQRVNYIPPPIAARKSL